MMLGGRERSASQGPGCRVVGLNEESEKEKEKEKERREKRGCRWSIKKRFASGNDRVKTATNSNQQQQSRIVNKEKGINKDNKDICINKAVSFYYSIAVELGSLTPTTFPLISLTEGGGADDVLYCTVHTSASEMQTLLFFIGVDVVHIIHLLVAISPLDRFFLSFRILKKKKVHRYLEAFQLKK